jgi:hypothetical protein
LNREPNYISEQENIFRFERAVTLKRVYRFSNRVNRFALFDVQKSRVEVASPRGYAPASPVSCKSRNIL